MSFQWCSGNADNDDYNNNNDLNFNHNNDNNSSASDSYVLVDWITGDATYSNLAAMCSAEGATPALILTQEHFEYIRDNLASGEIL